MIRRCLAIAFFFIAVFIPLFSSTLADDVSLHGFLQGNYSADTATKNPNGGDFKLAEERLQLKLDASRGPFHAFVKADGWYDHISEKGDSELREGYVDYTANKWDTRIGRQIITWGVGDLLFINDIFPKDYAAFFSGRPLEYLKKGINAARVGVYPGFASFELIATPFFEGNTFPDPVRFHLYDPFPGVTNRSEQKPAAELDNTEIALRIYRGIAGFDVSIYAYRGFFRQPSMLPDNPVMPTRLTLFFPKLSVYGASLQGRALDGVLSLEAGYYDSREDRSGNNPMIPNSQTKFLIGYQRQIWEDFTLGLQYYVEYMHNYSDYEGNLPAGFPKDQKYHDLTSVRLTQLLMHQTMRLSFFAFYSPSAGDYLLNPEIKYNFTDHIWAAIGANIFGGGNPASQFGQLAKDDNTYVQVRYEF
ncbi:MAG: hypothetical protein HY787_11440 [Deltaproteobacteria bacterium]|nr:hypothetical protein [Deltaproteobacteria bacterium]